MSKTIKIEYDSNILDIMEIVNEAIGDYGIEFIPNEEEHDGYELFTLYDIKKVLKNE